MEDKYKLFRSENTTTPYFLAGLQYYHRNFSRDSLISGILSSSSEIILSQLKFSASKQGIIINPINGEQLGRIHHEFPGVSLRNKETTYNGSDTTALYLIALEALYHIDRASYLEFVSQYQTTITNCVKYLLHNLGPDKLFIEKKVDNQKYALKVTYWKDSILPDIRGKEEPEYPISYALVHFMVARSLKSAAFILKNKKYNEIAHQLFLKGIATFIKEDHFVVYKDNGSYLRQISSDELHILAYIPKEYQNLIDFKALLQRSRDLRTKFGYICTPIDIARQLSDRYHGNVIWIFEQALINYGAQKFNLSEIQNTTRRIIPHIKDGQELYEINDLDSQELIPKGNTQQLWSIAAQEYFMDNSKLSKQKWL